MWWNSQIWSAKANITDLFFNISAPKMLSFCTKPLSALRISQPSLMLVATSALLLLCLSARSAEAKSVALPSPQCHPAVVNTMKPRIRQICKALEAIWEFSDVMENYLDEKGEWDVMYISCSMSYFRYCICTY